MPSGGFLVSMRYSWSRRRWAVDDMVACLSVALGLPLSCEWSVKCSAKVVENFRCRPKEEKLRKEVRI